MKKLRLEMDALRVESFPVANEEKPRGTVMANDFTEFESCRESFCPNNCTWADQCSAAPTCVYSCQTGPCPCVPWP